VPSAISVLSGFDFDFTLCLCVSVVKMSLLVS